MTQLSEDPIRANDYVDVLKNKRQHILADIARLRSEAAEIASTLSSKESQLHNLTELLALEGVDLAAGAEAEAVALPGHRSGRFIDAAWALLQKTSKPMHYQELAERLAAEGVRVPGTNPAANLIAHMSRDSRFGRGKARGVYGLADWPAIRAARAARQGRATAGKARLRRGSAA
jgi:hypothetical protein